MSSIEPTCSLIITGFLGFLTKFQFLVQLHPVSIQCQLIYSDYVDTIHYILVFLVVDLKYWPREHTGFVWLSPIGKETQKTDMNDLTRGQGCDSKFLRWSELQALVVVVEIKMSLWMRNNYDYRSMLHHHHHHHHHRSSSAGKIGGVFVVLVDFFPA